MTDFNYLMLALAGGAILLFALLSLLLVRRDRRRGGFERSDPRPEMPAAPEPAAAPTAPAPPYGAWRLISRDLANPDSAGGPLYRLRLEPEGALPPWRAGAVAHIYCGPAQDVLDGTGPGGAPAGEYMVGSLPAEGAVDVVVRLYAADASYPARRSHWLCQEVQTGQQIAMVLRENPDFLPPADDIPLILIGNATGLAGLQVQIKARQPGTRNWLIFGDRNSVGDRALAAELSDWVATGHLERCDLVFPGEGREQRHVTDQIDDARATLLDWVLAGAAIYVCGSRPMGDDVHTAFSELLGSEVLDAMADEGLYRRLLY